MVGSSYVEGDNITFLCTGGYSHLSGSRRRTCQADGMWSNASPVCGKHIYAIKHLNDPGDYNQTISHCVHY